MRRALLLVLCAVCVLMQVSFLPALRPLGVVPNLVLPLVAILALEGTVSLAAGVAVVGGLAIDLASGANFGLWTAVLMLAAVVAGLINRAGIEHVGPAAAAAIVAGGTLVMTIVVLSGLVSGVAGWPWGVLALRFASELMLNLGLVLVLGPVVRAIAGSEQTEVPVR